MMDFGFRADLRVADALRLLQDVLSPAHVVVIRSVDSARESDALKRVLDFHRISYWIVNGNFVLTLAVVSQNLDHLLTGFDEIWVFETVPEMNLNDVACVTSDAEDFSAGLPDSISLAFCTTACVVILGDGCGLNFVTANSSVAERLVSSAG
jgi:hypothetical protein